MITEPAKEAIRKELEAEGFSERTAPAYQEAIERCIEIYRVDKDRIVAEGVIKRLIVKYSDDKYQRDEIDKFFACVKCGKVGCDCEIEQPTEE